MKEVRKLLKILNENDPLSSPHALRICCDGSGSILTLDGRPVFSWRPSSDSEFNEEIHGFIRKLNKEKINKLLEEAKRRYPIGTTVRILGSPPIYSAKITSDNFIDWNGGMYVQHVDEEIGSTFDVYQKGQWAEIVEPELTTEEKLQNLTKKVNLIKEKFKEFNVK